MTNDFIFNLIAGAILIGLPLFFLFRAYRRSQKIEKKTATEVVVCIHCGSRIAGKPNRTFLGFTKYTCSVCHAQMFYPLGVGTRTVYWCLIGISILGIVTNGVPIILGGVEDVCAELFGLSVPTIIIPFALTKDYFLRKKLK